VSIFFIFGILVLGHGEPPGVMVCGCFIIPRVRHRLFFIVLVHLTIIQVLADAEKRIVELDNIFKRLYEDNISGKLSDDRFRKLSTDYESEQKDLQSQVLLLREEIETTEGESANVERFLSIVERFTDIPKLPPLYPA